uniref:Beta-1,4-galactosyltransferase n=1 Tax=Cynoglossus semilaevis TaxID=244447 RepID=A0A3P8V8A7_CYNSE
CSDSTDFYFLHSTCKVVVLLCLVHISVTLVFYVRSLDLRFAFAQNQQSGGSSSSNVSQRNQVQDSRITVKSQPDVKKLEKLGPLRVEFNLPVTFEDTKKANPKVGPGGHYQPPDCVPEQKVAVIIPFRNRDEHLKYWLYYLHPILQRQQLYYTIFVINQEGTGKFNRAKLLNVGYVEALKDDNYDCFVFSDVDLIPIDDRNTYKCFSNPRHLSAAMDKFGFKLPYNQFFGGVSSMSKQQILKINGFPNNYWGWGGEDDDIFNRLVFSGMYVSRPSAEIGKCRMIRHTRDKLNEDNPQRFDRIAHTRDTMRKDGLNSLTYKVVKKETFDLFTEITVDIGKP